MLASLLFGAALDRPAAAQETGATATAETRSEQPPVEPKTVPVGDVGVASERAKRQMKDSREALAPSEVAEKAAEMIPELRRQVELQVERSDAVRSAAPSVIALDRLQKEWDEIARGLTATQDALRRRGAEIDATLSSVRETRALWSATRARAIELGVDREVVQQIDDVLETAETTQTEAARRQAEMVGLQSHVAELSETAASQIEKILQARNAAVGQVLHRDSPPIWTGEFWQRLDVVRIGEQLASQESRDFALLVEYWRKHRERLVVYALLSVLLVALLLSSRRRIDARLAQESDLATVRAIFARPLALSLLVSFFVSLWVFPDIARTFEPLFVAATLIPAIVILRQILDRPLFPLLTVVTAVLFAHYFQEMIADAVVLSRLLFMAEVGALATFAAISLRPSRLAAVPSEMLATPLFRFVGYGLRGTFALSAITFVALTAGFGSLAGLVGGALIMALYAAIVLYGTFRVLDGIVAFLLSVRPLRLLGMVSRHRWLVQRRFRLVLQAGAWFIWARATLRRAEVWDDLVTIANGFLAAPLPLPEINITVGDIVAATLVFWGALLVSRFVRFALDEDVFSRVTLPKGRPYAISTLFHYGMLILGIVLGAAALGFDANRATLLTGAFGVGIGFGLQTIVNNFISGVILLTERPIQVGDTIAMGEVFGEVQRIGIRSSTVRTWQGAEVIVPNADLISQQVTNWTLSDRRRRLEIPVGVAYGSDPQLVIDTLLACAGETEGVLADPEPWVLFQGFGDSSLDFELRAWTDEFDSYLSIRSAICVRIVARLAEAGLEIPFPQRDLHLKTVNPEAMSAVGREPTERPSEATPLRHTGDDRRAG